MSEKDVREINLKIEQWATQCDREFVVRLIDTFLTDAPKRLALLRESFEHRAPDDFKRAAHTLKSSSGQLGADYYAETAKWVEIAGRDGRMAEMAEPVAWLEMEFTVLREALLVARANYAHGNQN